MNKAADALAELRALGNPADAAFLQRFFKTGKGQYGEGDVFLGIRVPATRRVAAKYRNLPLSEVGELLRRPEHEARLLAVIILTLQYPKADADTRRKIFDFYLKHTRYSNNWDIVDVSAPNVVGVHLYDEGDTSLLDELASSSSLWERRMAIVATHYFIRKGKFQPTLRIAKRLLEDEHDLIHKAVGWMLREVGKKDEEVLKIFLDKHTRGMPRTMLRYAIERLSPEERAAYMAR